MANSFRPKEVINGSYGECWISGDYMAETVGLKLDVDIKYEDITKPRKLGTYKKMLGYDGKGEVKLYQVTSRFSVMMTEALQEGRQLETSIISKLADPDAWGHERILVKDAVFENIPLADWEAAKAGEKSISFTFTEWQFLDAI